LNILQARICLLATTDLDAKQVQLVSSPRFEFFAGVRGVSPLLVGVIPFGLIFGAVAVSAGVPQNIAQAMSSIIFAGSSQFIAAQLIGSAAPGIVIVLTVFVVNLRHALYSASVAPYTKHLSSPWKWVLSYLLTDEAYAVTIMHYRRSGDEGQGNNSRHNNDPSNRHWYYLGAGLGLWLSWQISTAFGVFVGAQIPESWPLDFALPVSFIALVVPALRDRASVAAALAAGVVGVLALGLPYKLGLMVAALVGILAGLGIEGRPK
jgi:4-azaleucine resistance transporter AzlC